MNATRLYIIIGVVLVAVLVIVILLPDDNETDQHAGEHTNTPMPPGHPDIDAEGQPSRANVMETFMEEFERLKEQIEAQPESDTSDVLIYARMLLDAHQPANAVPLLERYNKAAPENTAVLLDLSVAHFENGDPDKAAEVTQRILRIDPENTTAMYNLGALAASQEDNETARRHWNKLIADYPDSPDAQRAMQFLENF
ncbi:MAG: tetratricopeptide repeat protein [Bacteroidetes bacterium]|nr:tetratricopeptide repeat protein [Bacteroidota bacterium]